MAKAKKKRVFILARMRDGNPDYWKWEDVAAGYRYTVTTDSPDDAFHFDSMTYAVMWKSYINAREGVAFSVESYEYFEEV